MSVIIPRSRIDPRVERAEDKRYRELCEAEDAQIAREEARQGTPPVESACSLCGSLMYGDSGICASCFVAFDTQRDYGGGWREGEW